MGIKREPFYYIICDECKKEFGNDIIDLFKTKEELFDAINFEWIKEGRKIYCGECYQRRSESVKL